MNINKKRLRYAFNKVLAAAERATCESLHHPKKHRHDPDEMCKAEYHLQQQAQVVREFMKENGI